MCIAFGANSGSLIGIRFLGKKALFSGFSAERKGNKRSQHEVFAQAMLDADPGNVDNIQAQPGQQQPEGPFIATIINGGGQQKGKKPLHGVVLPAGDRGKKVGYHIQAITEDGHLWQRVFTGSPVTKEESPHCSQNKAERQGLKRDKPQPGLIEFFE